MPRQASSKMLILASSNAAMWGRRLRTDRNASDRGAPRIAPETEPKLTGARGSTVKSIVGWTL